MKGSGMVWTVATFLALTFLTFALGIPTAFVWVVRKLWWLYAGMLAVFAVTFLPLFAGSPGVESARSGLMWGGALAFGVPFTVVFVAVGWRAWRSAWETLQDQPGAKPA